MTNNDTDGPWINRETILEGEVHDAIELHRRNLIEQQAQHRQMVEVLTAEIYGRIEAMRSLQCAIDVLLLVIERGEFHAE